MHHRNEELTRRLWEQEEIVAAERLRADRRAQAQMREFANLMAELMAGGEDPKFNWMVCISGLR